MCACVYILFLILFIPFAFSDVFLNDYEDRARHGLVVAEFPHQKVCLRQPSTSTSTRLTRLCSSQCTSPRSSRS